MQTSENISTCQRILQNHTEKELKEFHAEKIRELRKDGFCLDNRLVTFKNLGITRHFLDYVDDIRRQAFPERKRFVSVRRNYREILTWKEISGGPEHIFLKVDPKGFEFRYVDFGNFWKVMNVNASVIYLNTFWGIFVRNKTLGVDSMLQYDFDADVWYMTDFNLCDLNDGHKNRLPFRHPEKFEIMLGGHNFSVDTTRYGAVFGSFDDFVSANMRINEINLGLQKRKIEEHLAEAKRLSDLLEQNHKTAEEANRNLVEVLDSFKSRTSGKV